MTATMRVENGKVMGNKCRILPFVYTVIILAVVGVQKIEAQNTAPPPEGTIVALGDSLTEGYGVSQREAYPAQLERRLKQEGRHWRVINAGVSGETSSGTLARMDWILKLKPDIVILATGANDGLRGLDPKKLRDNLDQILSKLTAHGVTVVLAGMKMVPNLGRDYVEAFAAAYQETATAHDPIFMPFFLEGVAGAPKLNQVDGIHPTPEGYEVLVNHLLPYVNLAMEHQQQTIHK